MISFEKNIWTNEDFENMEWHDCKIYGMSFADNYEFLLDIDYILEWEKRQDGDDGFSFWVSPCTVVFENVTELKIDIEIIEPFQIQIQAIVRHNPERPINGAFINHKTQYLWTIETQQGTIGFKSVGYKLYLRQKPKLISKQYLGVKERGDIAFGKGI
jgi:hypothetical protein